MKLFIHYYETNFSINVNILMTGFDELWKYDTIFRIHDFERELFVIIRTHDYIDDGLKSYRDNYFIINMNYTQL